jgi:hypothetical protein
MRNNLSLGDHVMTPHGEGCYIGRHYRGENNVFIEFDKALLPEDIIPPNQQEGRKTVLLVVSMDDCSPIIKKGKEDKDE